MQERTDTQPNRAIAGVDAVVARFGAWPAFHDWEVVELSLLRSGISKLVLSFGTSVVEFQLVDVLDLEPVDFSSQNVISDLTIEPLEEGTCFTLGPCYGVTGWIVARDWSVSLRS